MSAMLMPNCDAAINTMNAAHRRDARSFGLSAITVNPSAAQAAATSARLIVRAGCPVVATSDGASDLLITVPRENGIAALQAAGLGAPEVGDDEPAIDLGHREAEVLVLGSMG